ncbi:MAG: hypothetical protein AB7G80_00335 [Dongiaceae bacterium]
MEGDLGILDKLEIKKITENPIFLVEALDQALPKGFAGDLPLEYEAVLAEKLSEALDSLSPAQLKDWWNNLHTLRGRSYEDEIDEAFYVGEAAVQALQSGDPEDAKKLDDAMEKADGEAAGKGNTIYKQTDIILEHVVNYLLDRFPYLRKRTRDIAKHARPEPKPVYDPLPFQVHQSIDIITEAGGDALLRRRQRGAR